MEIRESGRQLTEEEWVLLLDIYESNRNVRLSPSHPAILKASVILQALASKQGRALGDNARPPAGLYRQISFFEQLAKPQQKSNRKVPKLAEVIWQKYSNDLPACRAIAKVVRNKAGEP